MTAGKKIVQFPGEAETPVNPGSFGWSLPKTLPMAITPPVTAPQEQPAPPIPMGKPDASRMTSSG
jgi:hypothetical protein